MNHSRRATSSPQTLSEVEIGHALFFLTTEHATLQGARGNTVSESNGRISILLGVVSSSLVALGFAGQATQGITWKLFALGLFALILLLGAFTRERVLQLSIEDLRYARGINRIRHFYTELLPGVAPYFVLSTHDDIFGAMANMGTTPTANQILLTAAGMVSVINSAVLAVMVGLGLSLLGLGWLWLVPAGLLSLIAAVLFQERAQISRMQRAHAQLESLFPSPPVTEP